MPESASSLSLPWIALLVAIIFPTATLIFSALTMRQKDSERRAIEMHEDIEEMRVQLKECISARVELREEVLHLQRRVIQLENSRRLGG